MKSWRHILLGLIWLVAICCGLGILCVYDFTPGKDTGGAPKHWDASSGIPHSPDKATLVMFAHPQCPCTRASIGELAQLMAKCQGRVNAYVMFYHPSGTREDWAHTDLWESARTIPGVVVKGDEDGKEARRFEASTSGRVVVYGPQGDLLFNGGITESRGHAGDNAGLDSAEAVLSGGVAPMTETPVFGCSLLDSPGHSGIKVSCTR